jgi:hypothetical protein
VDLLKRKDSWVMALDFAGSFNAALTVEEALVTYFHVAKHDLIRCVEFFDESKIILIHSFEKGMPRAGVRRGTEEPRGKKY